MRDTRLYLHIGRNKAGSTTLQEGWQRHSDHMRRNGVGYAMFGQVSPPDRDFPSFSDHLALRDYVHEQQDAAVLVSHEGICCFDLNMVYHMVRELADVGLKILFYIRPYRHWILSSYKFDTRIGMNSCDVDEYFEKTADRISVRPLLETLAGVVGWERIRVRSLDTADLVRGSLLCDGFTAVGIEPPEEYLTARLPPRRANESGSFILTELTRTVRMLSPGVRWSSSDLAILYGLHDYAREAEWKCGYVEPDATYLPRDRAIALSELYNRDLDYLHDKTGISLRHDDPGDVAERATCPSAASIPADVMRHIRRSAGRPENVRRYPATAAFLDDPAFNALLEV